MSNLSLVLEEYAGKNSDFLKCEKLLAEIIELIKKDHESNFNVLRSRSVYRETPACTELSNTLTKIFNVGQINIFWNVGNINVYSLPSSSIVIAHRRNKKDFSKASFNICVYENLIYHSKLNERELMAVILHEIGHCFYSSPFLIAGELLDVVLSPMSVIMMFVGRGIYNVGLRIDNIIKQYIPVITNLKELIDNFKIQISYIFKLITIGFNVEAALRQIRNPIDSLAAYGGERGADSFATKYGYGADLISGLRKLEISEGTIGGKIRTNTGEFGDFFGDLSELTLVFYAMLSLNPHPSTDQRAQATIRKLERDLKNNDYPPELKSDLEAEIVRVKKVYSTLHDNQSNLEIKKAYFNMINSVTDGHSDLREIFNKFYEEYEF